MKSNWWSSATFEERYEQIKGGWELGMTQQQIALNLKVNASTIKLFAKQNLISFEVNRRDTNSRKMINYWTDSQTRIIEENKSVDNTKTDFAFDLFSNNGTKWALDYFDQPKDI